MSEDVKEIETRLNEAFQQSDDDQMEDCVLKLSKHNDQRSAAAILFRALLLRPWDGKKYDPKSWREEVRKALVTLYKLEEFKQEDKITEQIKQHFENPIEQLGPVHDLLIEEQKYCEWLSQYWKLIFEAVNAKQADDIETLVDRIKDLEQHLRNFRTDINKERAQFGLQVISSFEDMVRHLNE